MPCNMTGGSSGGPWVSTTNTTHVRQSVTTLRSLNSYGYSGISNMYGPKFNGNAQAVYNAAVTNPNTAPAGTFKITGIGSPE